MITLPQLESRLEGIARAGFEHNKVQALSLPLMSSACAGGFPMPRSVTGG